MMACRSLLALPTGAHPAAGTVRGGWNTGCGQHGTATDAQEASPSSPNSFSGPIHLDGLRRHSRKTGGRLSRRPLARRERTCCGSSGTTWAFTVRRTSPSRSFPDWKYLIERRPPMRLRSLAPAGILAGITLVASVAVQPVVAQDRASASVRGTGGNSTSPRTPWGDPDLQGVWTNTTLTPLERPETVAGREVLTEAERVKLDAQAADTLARLPGTGAYNDFWLERGKHSERTSLIVDPPDGRLPAVTPRAKQQADARTATIQRN